MANFTKLRATATRLIRKNGREVELVIDSKKPKDTTKPWRSNRPCSKNTVTVFAAIVKYNEKDIDGSRIKAGDRRALIEIKIEDDAEIDLRFYDLLIDRDERWRIENIEKIEPSTTTVVYDAQLRT